MEEEEYLNIQFMLFQIGCLIEGANLTGFISAINRADTMGPILDPTLWMRGQEKMRQIRDMAVALRSFQEAYQMMKGGER